MADKKSPVVVIDNGGANIKAGFAGTPNPKRIIPNALARGKRDKKLYVGDKILSSPIAEYIISRPSQRGLVVDWETEKFIWQHSLFVRDKSGMSFNIQSEIEQSTAVVTTAAFSPQSVRQETLDVILKDFRFSRAVLIDSTVATQFSPGITDQFTKEDWLNPCGLLIDCGFSATTIIPVFHTQPVLKAAQRLPVGGRVLNNLLRERLAYLQIDLDDNPLLLQHVKESVCCVAPVSLKSSLDELQKLREKNDIVEYKLPEFSSPSTQYVGHVLSEASVDGVHQSIKIGADRIAIPEAIFNPLTFGIDKLGIVDAIVRAISLCDECIRGPVASKLILSGGTAMLPGFVERLLLELQSAIPTVAPDTGAPIRLLREPDGRYDLSAWRGASQVATSKDDLDAIGAISREDWISQP